MKEAVFVIVAGKMEGAAIKRRDEANLAQLKPDIIREGKFMLHMFHGFNSASSIKNIHFAFK